MVAVHCRCHTQYSACDMPKRSLSFRDRQMFERPNVEQKRGTSLWEGLSRPSPLDSPGDEGYDIFRKLSASSLHQMMHIHESGTGPGHSSIRRGGGWRTEAPLGAAIRLIRSEIATVSLRGLTNEHFFDSTGPLA